MSTSFLDSGDFQFNFDATFQGLNPFEALDTTVPEIDMDLLDMNFDFSLDDFTALDPSIYEPAMLPSPERKLSASRWVPCTPPPQPQRELSRWAPMGTQSELAGRPSTNFYPDPEQLFGMPQPQYATVPYFTQPPPGNVPFHDFSQITPPGSQISSINYPVFTPGSMLPLGPPPKGKFRQIESCIGPEDLALSPRTMQRGQKRKSPAPLSLRKKIREHETDFNLPSAGLSPGDKKKGRPFVYKQTKETIERNARRKADYHKRKNDPAYMAKMNQWSREYYQRKKYGISKKTEKPKQAHSIDGSEGSDEYVCGESASLPHGEEVVLRRSSRQPKPIFAHLDF